MSNRPEGPASRPAPPDTPVYPRALGEAEAALLRDRRRAAGLSAGADRAGAPQADAVGLALSGGGIRSATFCLGVCQALARRGLLRRVDYLSTVSGGGYVGSFIGALIARQGGDGIGRAEVELADERSRVVDWLRENGRYLSPNGSGDEVLAGVVLLRNAVAVQAVLVTAAVALLSVAIGARIVAELWWNGWQIPRTPSPWSPYAVVPLLLFGLIAVPHAWAYWMVPTSDAKPPHRLDWWALKSSAAIGVCTAAAALALVAVAVSGNTSAKVLPLAAVCAATTLLLIGAWGTLAYHCRRAGRGCGGSAIDRQQQVRNRLSSHLAWSLWFALPFLGLAAVDALAVQVFQRWGHEIWEQLPAGGVWAGAIWMLRSRLKQAGGAAARVQVSLRITVVAAIAAILLIGIALVAVATAVHAVAWHALLVPAERSPATVCLSLLLLLAVSAGASYSFGRALRFLNDSSDHALYGARLARAYLGASNPARLTTQPTLARRVTDPIAGDNLAMKDYAPEQQGGPLHLINATLNETVSGESLIEHRDRKGLAFAVGPAGLSVGGRHHALWATAGGGRDTAAILPIAHADPQVYHALADGAGQQRHPVEPLSLSTWVAISGAAVAPGLGSRTSLGASILLTLFNVRLGYWWDSHIEPESRPGRIPPGLAQRIGERIAAAFPVQTHLCYELLSRFYGPNRRRWYLSDGGHFENTGCYELIRRRVPFILACDCGQDPDWAFDDVANLVRKARADFQAEIRFMSREEMGEMVDAALRAYLGTPAEFERCRRAPAGTAMPPYGMLAEVTYADGSPSSRILFIKPALRGDEPEDVRNYARTHGAFPNESTADQYFDEAQWESYRRLGEVIGGRLLEPRGTAHAWVPWQTLASRPASRAAA